MEDQEVPANQAYFAVKKKYVGHLESRNVCTYNPCSCLILGHIRPSSIQSGPGTIGLSRLLEDEGAPCW